MTKMTQTDTLEVQIGRLLTARGLTLAVAESCTGGLICHRLTNVPGSSAYFLGGVVSYANSAKEELLGVSRSTLERFGAVSAETAVSMAQGVRRRFGADISVAVTGIAGPTGGTPEKPVGLTYVALDTVQGTYWERHVWSGDRLANKESSAQAALIMLLTYLKEQ